jgi:hypothetical protein
MARRPTGVLNQLLRRRRRRPISAADGNRELYVLDMGTTPTGKSILKIGMTTDFERRLGEHERNCPNPNRRVLKRHRVAFRRREGRSITVYSTCKF